MVETGQFGGDRSGGGLLEEQQQSAAKRTDDGENQVEIVAHAVLDFALSSESEVEEEVAEHKRSLEDRPEYAGVSIDRLVVRVFGQVGTLSGPDD